MGGRGSNSTAEVRNVEYRLKAFAGCSEKLVGGGPPIWATNTAFPQPRARSPAIVLQP